ncbi:MAG: Ldh family oxidoreductase, partial [Anaerolineae bacterium]|nr:Ldh family oxidoreductase [Anaerolineae bacterium]
MAEFVRVAYETLKTFCRAVFERYGLNPQDAETSADVLLAADLRGIPSHGIARMPRYVNGLKKGLMVA